MAGRRRADDTGRPRRRVVAAAAALLAAAAAVAAVLVVTLGSSADEEAPRVAPTATTAPPSATPTPTPTARAEVVIDEVRTMPYTPVWNPPDGGNAFWQVVDDEHGYPRDGGTDYVLAHACKDRECAGDRVRELDVEDRLTYLGETYEVDEKIEIRKTEIGAQDIWTHDPDRLVVITCILDPETGRYDENDIIVAHRTA